MSHLTPSEFVDLLEGQLAAERARHADSCAACRSQLEDLQAALRQTAGLPLPEPSPLFWDHFTNCIREGIAQPEPAGRPRLDWMRLHPRAAFAALAALLVLVAAGWRVLPPQRAGDRGAERTAISTADPASAASDPAADRAWDAVRAAAANLAWEDAQEAGIAAPPGSAEQAILELSDSERQHLMSLLEEELKRTGA